MGPTEVVILIVVLFVIYYFFKKENIQVLDTTSKPDTIAQAVPPAAGDSVLTASTMPAGEVERQALATNASYYSSIACDTAAQNMCCGFDSERNFAEYAWGAPGASFKDYITSQGVSPDVVANHAEFVADRMKYGNVTRGPGAVGQDLEALQPVPWLGLRRPRLAPLGNPDRVPDMDMSFYAAKDTINWTGTQ